jgi:hypothetical protein
MRKKVRPQILTSVSLALALSSLSVTNAFAALSDGLVSHWPMEVVQGTKSPDVAGGYDMDLSNLTAADLVPGKVGKTFSFSFAKQTMLSRIHAPGEKLPINQHPSFTIAMWAKIAGPGQIDLRLFSEGTTASTDPLFNIGTHSGGSSGQVDFLIRQSGWTTVDHIRTTAEPFDDTWHHIAFVQNNGERTFYVDGVADDLVIPAKPAGTWRVIDTSIGGIHRASKTHWVTGLIDEVALWSRALTPAELTTVMNSGVPSVTVAVLPLEIRSFTSDFSAAAQGDKVMLRWDATKDATLSIDNGVGNVTTNSVAGVGSLEVTVNATTTYTLTASRGTESKTAKVTVLSVSGVAAGWRVLENFDNYAAGPILGKGGWKNPEGAGSVIDLGLNKTLGYDAGTDIIALDLKSQTLKQGQKATLFFRMYGVTTNSAPAVTVHVGMTDAPIRTSGDLNTSTGPYVRFEKFVDETTIAVQARNGIGAAYDPAALMLDYGAVYNVWIDIQNDPIDTGDIYSVYIQKQGETARTLLFDKYISDRAPAGNDQALGPATPDLTSLFVSAPAAAQGVNAIMFDDFYLSRGAFVSTVPVAPSSFVTAPTTSTNQTTLNLIAIDDKQSWRYENTGKDLGTTWKDKTFNDAAWPQGFALLAAETGATPVPIRTTLVRADAAGANIITDYFRTHFTFTGNPANVQLKLRHVVDDGMVLYINGTEAYRIRVAAGQTYTTLAGDHENAYEGPFDIPSTALVSGDNVIAVEVHQTAATSSDVVFGMELQAVITGAATTAPKFAAVTRTGTTLNLTWTGTGTLQSATSITGPWTDVASANSPFSAPISGTARFYRLR